MQKRIIADLAVQWATVGIALQSLLLLLVFAALLPGCLPPADPAEEPAGRAGGRDANVIVLPEAGQRLPSAEGGAGGVASASVSSPGARDTDAVIKNAFKNRRSGLQVQGEGVVTRVLPDDVDGSRHQRFILRLGSGHTLLMTHNIDVAPRVDELAAGDTIGFYGVYEWNEKGGIVHWTHHDPDGRHTGGRLEHRGNRYE